MKGSLVEGILSLARKRESRKPPLPLLVELLQGPREPQDETYQSYPFSYAVKAGSLGCLYNVWPVISPAKILELRTVVGEISSWLDPEEVQPLTLARLVEVLRSKAAELLATTTIQGDVADLAELAAYEAIGLSRMLALAKDEKVTEYFVDSDVSPIYLDHARAGRCETDIILTERERQAVATHLDTFGGYTADFVSPSLKNDLMMSGALLRVSLDLEPLSVNRFALDVRRLNLSTLDLKQLVGLGVLSPDAAGFLVGWLECGGNVTIVGETGTGKTTLLNALDEELDPRLRRVYIEDSVETKDLIQRGYHQMKLKVDPFDRGSLRSRTKGSEIVKALHRSPDLVILSEIQSEEHSRAFFHSLAAGTRGIQTFHATTVEQAVGRWVNVHHIPRESILDLGVVVQMIRPDRLGQGRFVQRICAVVPDSGAPRTRELFLRDRRFELVAASDVSSMAPPSSDHYRLVSKAEAARAKLLSGGRAR